MGLGTVRGALAVEIVLLHRALETFALGDADDVDELAGLEAGDGDRVALLASLRRSVRELARRISSACSRRLLEVAELGLGDAVFLLVEDADLDGGVTVVVDGLDLQNRVRFGEDDGDGRDGPGLVVDAGHAYLLS